MTKPTLAEPLTTRVYSPAAREWERILMATEWANAYWLP